MINNSTQFNWYVLYTKPRAEKKAQENLLKEGFITYLPCITTIKQWSDRKKKVVEPMFKSYLFIQTLPSLLNKSFQQSNIVGSIKFNGKPAIIRDAEIALIRNIENNFDDIEVTSEQFTKGASIEIINGELKGQTGTLIEFRNKKRVAIQIESLECNVLLEIKENLIKTIK